MRYRLAPEVLTERTDAMMMVCTTDAMHTFCAQRISKSIQAQHRGRDFVDEARSWTAAARAQWSLRSYIGLHATHNLLPCEANSPVWHVCPLADANLVPERSDPERLRVLQALQHSRRRGDLLLKHEQEEAQIVSQYANELMEREYMCVSRLTCVNPQSIDQRRESDPLSVH